MWYYENHILKKNKSYSLQKKFKPSIRPLSIYYYNNIVLTRFTPKRLK